MTAAVVADQALEVRMVFPTFVEVAAVDLK